MHVAILRVNHGINLWQYDSCLSFLLNIKAIQPIVVYMIISLSDLVSFSSLLS